MPNNKNTYKHIIWDWNGTLIDDSETCAQVLNAVLAKYGKSLTTFAQYRQTFGFPVADFYEGLGFDFAKESYDQLADDYIEIYAQRQLDCQLHVGVTEVLQACRDRGLSQSILSACHQAMLEEAIDRLHIAHFFTHAIGRQDYHAKSKIQLGRGLLQDLGVPAWQILVIGDTLHDFEVARDLGTPCLLVGNGHQHPDRLRQCGVPVLASVHEVMGWASPGG